MRVSQLLTEGKRRPDLTYTPHEVKGKVERLTVQLKGKDSTAMTKLAKEYMELAESIETLSAAKDNLNKEIRAKVLDLFDAEDDILTRVVETVSFTATVAKQTPQAPDKEEITIDYTAILKELTQMVPDLESKIESLTKTYTTVTKKAAAKPKEPALRVDMVKEGVIETVLGYVSKVVESFKAWCFSYDKRLDKLKAKLKVASSKKVVKEQYEDHCDYSSAEAGIAAAKNDAKEKWVHKEDIGTPKKDKALASHMKAAVGAKKEFIDAYIAQLYKSFKVKQINEAAKKWNDKENFKKVSLSFLERYDLEQSEIDGFNVLVAYDDKDVVGVYYSKAKFGTFNLHSQADDVVEYTESDPHYPYEDINEEVDSNDPYEMIAALKKIKGIEFAELDGKNITFSVNGEDFLLKNKTSSWDLLVNGYKQSLEVSDGLTTAKEVVAAAKTVNNKWFKEHDPQYYPR